MILNENQREMYKKCIFLNEANIYELYKNEEYLKKEARIISERDTFFSSYKTEYKVNNINISIAIYQWMDDIFIKNYLKAFNTFVRANANKCYELHREEYIKFYNSKANEYKMNISKADFYKPDVIIFKHNQDQKTFKIYPYAIEFIYNLDKEKDNPNTHGGNHYGKKFFNNAVLEMEIIFSEDNKFKKKSIRLS